MDTSSKQLISRSMTRWGHRIALLTALTVVLGAWPTVLPSAALGQASARLPGERSAGVQLRQDGARIGDAATINLPGPTAIKCTGSSCTDYRRGVGVDVRRWATCDGTTDDKAAFDAAYAALNAAGGGTIVVPAGATCRVSAQITGASHVDLVCEPGGTLKATDAASFSLGMVSHFLTNNADVIGCTFDLNGRKGPGLALLGATGVRVERNVIKNGAPAEGSEWSLLAFHCTSSTGPCEAVANRVECANASGANDVGITVGVAGDDAQVARIIGNQVRDCDVAGIKHSAGAAVIAENAVTVIGASADGISSAAESAVAKNRITASGANATGLRLTAAGSGALLNRVSVSGASAVAYRLAGTNTVAMGNRHALSATGATADGFGYHVGGQGTRIIGAIGTAAGEAQTHVAIAAGHVSVIGSNLSGGKYGVVPSIASATELASAINADVLGTRIMGLEHAVIAITGWAVEDNYLAWNSGCGVTLGEARGAMKYGTNHTRVSNNRLHTGATGKGICVPEIPNETCAAGSQQHQACTADNTTQCPGATCGNCCTPSVNVANVNVGGNEFLYSGSSGPAVDLSAAVSSSSASVGSIVIDGSNAVLGPSVAFLACPSTNQNKVTNVALGENLLNGGVYKSNCTTAMVRDASELATCLTRTGVAASDDSSPFWLAPFPLTVTGFACSCVGGCATTATFALEDRAGNGMTHAAPTCSTSSDAAFVGVTAGGAMNEGEGLAYDVTNSPTSGMTYMLCVRYRKA